VKDDFAALRQMYVTAASLMIVVGKTAAAASMIEILIQWSILSVRPILYEDHIRPVGLPTRAFRPSQRAVGTENINGSNRQHRSFPKPGVE